MKQRPANLARPWTWIPSLYVAEGLPYVVVMAVSVVLFKDLGISNTKIALYTSWLYLPWVVKPLWSPLVDILRTRRWWIWTMQLTLGACFACVALTLPLEGFFRWALIFFWLAAFSSATHDIAADGFYLLALSEKQQAFFVGIRSTFYRVASIAGQGLLVMLVGVLQERSGNTKLAWMVGLFSLATLLILFGVYHAWALPKPASDRKGSFPAPGPFLEEFGRTFASFFQKPQIVVLLLFLLFYRFAEAQLVKLATPFLMDAREGGGLGLLTRDVGFAYGTIGVAALVVGGILGGLLISRDGLKRWLWPMVVMMNVPNVVYLLLSVFQPERLWPVVFGVGLEQFGYGFGFSAYMMYMIRIARGSHQTAHYALCTGFMALGMMLPGMASGALQEAIGYQLFFGWVLLATIPSFVVVAFIPLEPEFGRREAPAGVEEG